MTSVFWFSALCSLFLFPSCLLPRYSLNEAEKDFIQQSGKDVYGRPAPFGASIRASQTINIFYDRVAIRKLRTDGVYTVVFEIRRGLFVPDSASLKAGAVAIAQSVREFMNFRDHHTAIEVVFRGLAPYGTSYDALVPQCRYAVRMPLPALDSATVTEYRTYFVSYPI